MATDLREYLDSLEKYPMNEARDCIMNYVNNALAGGIKNEKIVRAFTVKANDVIDVLGIEAEHGKPTSLIMEYTHFRAYIGEQRELLHPDQFTFKLFLVPVTLNDDGEYVDVIPVNANGEQFVYDFNTPCPNSCDYSSPLYYSGPQP